MTGVGTMRTTQRARTRRGRRSRPARLVSWFDERYGPAAPLRRMVNRVFPDRWSLMMGEVALYAFVVLLLTGIPLAFWFDASAGETAYHGRYVPLDGVPMSRAYASTLHISFDLRGGLLIRQIHYWAALLFMAAMLVYLCRMFFTGMFGKPRELNWLIGLLVLIVGIVESYSGHLLPDDLLSGTGMRVADATILSIPLIGTATSYLIFGSPFPGGEWVGRLYIAHVVLLPAVLVALIGLQVVIARRQRLVDVPGPDERESSVAGDRSVPAFTVRAAGLFLLVFAVLAALGGLAQINPVWLAGPYNPAQVSALSGPDWYLGFIDGSSRLFPSWEIRLWNHDVPPLFWATVVLPGILFTLAAAYPFIEAKLTRDQAHHHVLQRARDNPVRTSLGAMALTFYLTLFVAGASDSISRTFDISGNAMIWGGRIALLILPPIAYALTFRICLDLQFHDRDVLDHGAETGIIHRLPSGAFIEVRRPLVSPDEPEPGVHTREAAAS